MTLDPTATLSLYDEAWAISDYESRLVSLRTFWADDGLYVDPDVPEGARGPEALATEIERQLKLYPGMSIVSSAADVLGGPRLVLPPPSVPAIDRPTAVHGISSSKRPARGQTGSTGYRCGSTVYIGVERR